MKKLNLTIKIDDLDIGPKKLSVSEIVKSNIESTIIIYSQQVQGITLSDQRKVYKILEALNKGIIFELEDSEFDFIYKVYHEAKFVGAVKIVVRIADKLEESKLNHKI